MKRAFLIVCVGLLMIASIPCKVTATDPTVYLQGYIYVDGQEVDEGFIVNCFNADRDNNFDAGTDGTGWYNMYIGTDLQAGDTLEISQTPLLENTLIYNSIVKITVEEIVAGALRYDMRFVTSGDNDQINIGSATHNNYVWIASPQASDLQRDYHGQDFELTIVVAGHLNTPTILGAAPNQYPTPPNQLNPALTYQGIEHYEVIVSQMNPADSSTDQLDSNSNWAANTFTFTTGTTAHWDPTAKIYINENNANFHPGWIYILQGNRHKFIVHVDWVMELKQNGQQLWTSNGNFDFTFYGKSVGPDV